MTIYVLVDCYNSYMECRHAIVNFLCHLHAERKNKKFIYFVIFPLQCDFLLKK